MNVRRKTIIILSLVLTLIPASCKGQRDVTTELTEQGVITGHSRPFADISGAYLDMFFGVPYAKPPLGALRWQEPQAPDVFLEDYEAIEFKPCCVQNLDHLRGSLFDVGYSNVSEDCLYLNIYAPWYPDQPVSGHPVMVWIHGGDYQRGCAEDYDMRILAERGGVVVITLNYRLGVLGFLSTGDDIASGNFGLKDIAHALKWINKNIASFGGDPQRVTLFGQNAGAYGTSLMTLTSQVNGLFHRVICESGDALSPRALSRDSGRSQILARELATSLGCHEGDMSSLEMLNCLRQQDAQSLVEHGQIIHEKYETMRSFTDTWVPRVDGEFIKDTPENLLKTGSYNRVDILAGTVLNEYSQKYASLARGLSRTQKEARFLSWSERFGDHAEAIHRAVSQEYDEGDPDHGVQRDLFLQMLMDDTYVAPLVKHLGSLSPEDGHYYMYTFRYRSAASETYMWLGVTHFEEVYFTLGVPYWNEAVDCPADCSRSLALHRQRKWDSEDKLMATKMMEAWTNFAKTGDPSTEVNYFLWSEYNSETQTYAEIRRSEWMAKHFYRYKRTRFVNVYREYLLDMPVCPSDLNHSQAVYSSQLLVLSGILMAVWTQLL